MSNYHGRDWDIINTPVTGASYTEVTYTKPIKAFFHHSRNDVTLFLKRANADTKFITIIPGDKPAAEVILSNSSASSASLGFIKTNGADDIVETLVIF